MVIMQQVMLLFNHEERLCMLIVQVMFSTMHYLFVQIYRIACDAFSTALRFRLLFTLLLLDQAKVEQYELIPDAQ